MIFHQIKVPSVTWTLYQYFFYKHFNTSEDEGSQQPEIVFCIRIVVDPRLQEAFYPGRGEGHCRFYETPAGKKLAEKTPMITMESMQLSQTWAMSLMGKIQAYLN